MPGFFELRVLNWKVEQPNRHIGGVGGACAGPAVLISPAKNYTAGSLYLYASAVPTLAMFGKKLLTSC